MARTPYEDQNGQAGSVSGEEVSAIRVDGQDTIALPGADVKSAELTREGQDLIIKGPDGAAIVIEDYFSAEPAPVLQGAHGETLTPSLVQSFLQPAGPLQYAGARTLSDASPVGAVQEVVGKATVIRTSGHSEQISVGTPVYEGDIIETEGDGAVNILFLDESSLAVSQNARLAIDEYVFDPAGEGGKSDFSILRGLFVFTSGLIGRDDPDDVQIETPMGSIGIRGTVIAGNVDTGEITVMEGAIVLRGINGSEVTLSQPYETARFDTATGGVVYMDKISAESFDSGFSTIKSVAPALFSTLEPDSGETTQQKPEPMTEQPAETAPQPAAETGFFDSTPDAGFETVLQPYTTLSAATNQTAAASTDNSVITAAAPATTNTNTNTTTDTTTTPPPPAGDSSGGNSATVLELKTIGAADGFQVIGPAGSNANLGIAIAAFGNPNGDMYGNFIVANNKTSGGQVFDYNGNVVANSINTASLTPAIDYAGDFNGDGFADVVIGSPFSNNVATNGGMVIVSNAGIVLSAGLSAGDYAGASVSGIGDVNGDGFSDVLFGAHGMDNGGTDRGSAFILFGDTAAGPRDAGALTNGVRIDNATDNQMFGITVSRAGDFDNDGYADFMVSKFTATGAEVSLFLGDSSSVMFDNIADSIHTFTGIKTDGSGVPVMHMGDINGDGISDIAIADTLDHKLHFIFGGVSVDNDLSDNVGFNGFTLVHSGAGSIDSGGFAGDFNGDGHDDAVIVIRNGNVADIFVMYGQDNLTGTIDTQSLYNNPDQAFHMTYTIGHNSPFQFTIASAGDVNGDGFEDVIFGTPDAHNGDGGFVVVYGRNDTALSADGKQVHIAGQTTALNDVVANGNGQSLVGNADANMMNDNGHSGVSFRAGAGHDNIMLTNDLFALIDGGAGFDTVNLTGQATYDLTGKGAESLSGIERFAFMEDGQSLMIGIDDIFRLMQQSAQMLYIGGENRRVLKFHDVFEQQNGPDSGNTSLHVETNGTADTSLNDLGFTYSSTYSDGGANYQVWEFGGTSSGYALLIDVNIENVSVG